MRQQGVHFLQVHREVDIGMYTSQVYNREMVTDAICLAFPQRKGEIV